MTRRLARAFVVVFVVGAVLVGISGASLAQQPAANDRAYDAVQNAIEWLKIIGGVFGFLIGGYGIWVYSRTTARTKTAEALEATVDIYKQQIDALTARDVTREKQHTEMITAMQDREKEVSALRARTDLSEVLKGVQLLAQAQSQSLQESANRDHSMIELLSGFMRSSEQRYESGMKIMSGMLEATATQAKQNFDLASALTKSVDTLSKRFGEVEKTVDHVAEAVDQGEPSKPGDGRQAAGDAGRSKGR